MKEHIFKSKLSDKEINKNFEDDDIFSGIMDGLAEALEYEKGNARAATVVRKRKLPKVDVAATRNALNLTQEAFAAVLGVSKRTVEAWEGGRSNPSPTAKNLIYLIDSDHSLINKLRQDI